MINTNFIDLHSLVRYAKFLNHRPSGSDEDCYSKNSPHKVCIMV